MLLLHEILECTHKSLKENTKGFCSLPSAAGIIAWLFALYLLIQFILGRCGMFGAEQNVNIEFIQIKDLTHEVRRRRHVRRVSSATTNWRHWRRSHWHAHPWMETTMLLHMMWHRGSEHRRWWHIRRHVRRVSTSASTSFLHLWESWRMTCSTELSMTLVMTTRLHHAFHHARLKED